MTDLFGVDRMDTFQKELDRMAIRKQYAVIIGKPMNRVICLVPLRGIDDLDLRENPRASSACFEERREGLRDVRPERNEDGLIGEGASGQRNSRQGCVKGKSIGEKCIELLEEKQPLPFLHPIRTLR